MLFCQLYQHMCQGMLFLFRANLPKFLQQLFFAVARFHFIRKIVCYLLRSVRKLFFIQTRSLSKLDALAEIASELIKISKDCVCPIAVFNVSSTLLVSTSPSL